MKNQGFVRCHPNYRKKITKTIARFWIDNSLLKCLFSTPYLKLHKVFPTILNITFLSLFFFSVNGIHAQNFKKIFGEIEKETRLIENKVILEKSYWKNPSNFLTNYGLALISKKSMNIDDLVEAWFHIQIASNSLKSFTTFQIQQEVLKVVKDPDVITRDYKSIDSLLWERFKKTDDLNKLQSLLNKLENSEYYNNYIGLRNNLEFEEAVRQNSIEAFTRFINLYPDAEEIPEILKRKDSLDFQIAFSQDVIFIYNDFISKHPESTLLDSAVNRRDKKAFDLAKNSGNIDDFDYFLNNYPNAPDMGKALAIRENLVFKSVMEQNDIKSFQDFIHLYPRSSSLSEAILKRDELVFNEIQQLSDYDSFRIFMSGLPFAQTIIKTFFESLLKNYSSGNKQIPNYSF